MGRPGRSPNAGSSPVSDWRKRAAAGRQWLADEREQEADERERLADEREQEADEREQEADERERLADEREQEADKRERLADEREKQLYELAHEIGGQAADIQRRTQEAIERSRARLMATRNRLERSAAVLRRSEAGALRAGAKFGMASLESEQELARRLPDPAVQTQRAKLLRRRLAAAAAALAAVEEELARTYDELAGRGGAQGSERRCRAEAAREAARQARKIDDQFRD
jgi:hypothetical protein